MYIFIIAQRYWVMYSSTILHVIIIYVDFVIL